MSISEEKTGGMERAHLDELVLVEIDSENENLSRNQSIGQYISRIMTPQLTILSSVPGNHLAPGLQSRET